MTSPQAQGFTQHFLSQLDEFELNGVFDPSLPLRPGRVAFASRDRLRLLGETDTMAQLTPHLFDIKDPFVVGDWVVVDHSHEPPLVTRRLERTSLFRRRNPRGGVQPVAANVDLALVCMAVGHDFNARRIERWLSLCHEAQVEPLVLLTKADQAPEAAQEFLASLEDVEAIVVSAIDGQGMEELAARLLPGRTATLLGSSGVGKSTLVNALLGEELQSTGEVRETDGKGRHTTTARTLLRLPSGALLIDNPGVREVGLVDTEGVDDTFPEVQALLGTCRYRDCHHEGEDGCALDAAVAEGVLSTERLESWRKLQKEAAFEARRQDKAALAAEQRRWKRTSQANRQRLKASRWQKGQKD